MRTIFLGAAAAVLIATAACGASVVGAGGNGNSGGGAPTSPCPTAEPTSGVACTGVTAGFRCTYGDDVRPDCRHEWLCEGGSWVTTKSICLEPPAGSCASAEPTEGALCTGSDGSVCTYGNDICICGACTAGPCMQNAVWSCAKPPSGSGCPAAVPNDGTACSVPGADCTYGFPCAISGTHVTCSSGTWLWDMNIACAL